MLRIIEARNHGTLDIYKTKSKVFSHSDFLTEGFGIGRQFTGSFNVNDIKK